MALHCLCDRSQRSRVARHINGSMVMMPSSLALALAALTVLCVSGAVECYGPSAAQDRHVYDKLERDVL